MATIPGGTHFSSRDVRRLKTQLGGVKLSWEGCHESRRCSRDTYPESYITEYTSTRRLCGEASRKSSWGRTLASTARPLADASSFFATATRESACQAFRVHLTEIVCKVGLHKSIPAQIRQLIVYASKVSELRVYEDPKPHAWSMCAACFCPCISQSRATLPGQSRYQTSEFLNTF